MRRLPQPDAKTVAVVAALAAFGLLVTLIVWRRQDLLGVGLALLCVLLATIAGVAVSAARQRDDAEAVDAGAPPEDPVGGLYGIDADTLESLGDREAIHAARERNRQPSGSG